MLILILTGRGKCLEWSKQRSNKFESIWRMASRWENISACAWFTWSLYCLVSFHKWFFQLNKGSLGVRFQLHHPRHRHHFIGTECRHRNHKYHATAVQVPVTAPSANRAGHRPGMHVVFPAQVTQKPHQDWKETTILLRWRSEWWGYMLWSNIEFDGIRYSIRHWLSSVVSLLHWRDITNLLERRKKVKMGNGGVHLQSLPRIRFPFTITMNLFHQGLINSNLMSVYFNWALILSSPYVQICIYIQILTNINICIIYTHINW